MLPVSRNLAALLGMDPSSRRARPSLHLDVFSADGVYLSLATRCHPRNSKAGAWEETGLPNTSPGNSKSQSFSVAPTRGSLRRAWEGRMTLLAHCFVAPHPGVNRYGHPRCTEKD